MKLGVTSSVLVTPVRLLMKIFMGSPPSDGEDSGSPGSWTCTGPNLGAEDAFSSLLGISGGFEGPERGCRYLVISSKDSSSVEAVLFGAEWVRRSEDSEGLGLTVPVSSVT